MHHSGHILKAVFEHILECMSTSINPTDKRRSGNTDLSKL